jgi:hypothetical protein
MKRKLVDVQSHTSLTSTPSKAFSDPTRARKIKNMRAPSRINDSKPLASRGRASDETEKHEAPRKAKRVKMETLKVRNDASVESDSSFADIDDFESE